MGQKVNPVSFRLGSFGTWTSRWFAEGKKYQNLLLDDIKIRKRLMQKLKLAGISKVEIERSINKVDIKVFVAKPGLVIGRGGSGIEDLKKEIESLLNIKKDDKNSPKLDLKVEQLKEPNLNAYLVAMGISDGLAKRQQHRRLANQAIERVIGAEAKGIRIRFAGRINGAEISRKEKFQSGSIPLSSLREKIDFAIVPSLTKSGYIGVKVWIYR